LGKPIGFSPTSGFAKSKFSPGILKRHANGYRKENRLF
jgi:hypothetical protein